jgi:hypothetical protein
MWFLGFFRGRALVFLLLLAPMAEYLTGSTQLSFLVLNPPIFFVFLVQNLGSYGGAVLLAREAKVRWQKGWASVLLLGAAYGIVNEGIGADTLFYPGGAIAGALGTYGRWLGVNWVWSVGLVLLVHPLFSVSLPMLLFALAFPEMRGRSLVGRRGIATAFVALGVSAVFALLFVSVARNYYAGPVLWGSSLAVIAALVLAAHLIPANVLMPRSQLPRTGPSRFFVLGALFIWVIIVGGNVMATRGAPPALAASFFVATGALALLWVVRNVGRTGNDLQFVALGTGLVASLVPMGLSSQLGTGFGLVPVVAGDVAVVVFFRHLWRKHGRLRSVGVS